MKIVHFFVQVFTIFAFLTLGSLMIIVSLHVLTMEDALLKIQDLYENPWRSLQIGISGIFFIVVGLSFTKNLVKQVRRDEEVVLYGKWGYVAVSVRAVDELVKRIIKKFDVVRDMKVETDIDSNQVKIVANLTVLSGWNLAELINAIQSTLSERLQKMLGGNVELDLAVNVIKIIEHEDPAAKI